MNLTPLILEPTAAAAHVWKSCTVAFMLSMPNRGSWNGGWSGDANCYAVLKRLSGKTAQKVMSRNHYSYNFGDGWRAEIEVKVVNAAESRSLRKRTQGFCGYEWMIESIIHDGSIYGPTQPKPVAEPIQK